MSNPLWFKDAVIYQVHIKSFYDSNGDGVGDFRGLIEKIDYFAELGVTAVWLLPFYPSPLRDDGYDIADYYSVNPTYGTMEDFQEFLREAHKRGLRVITELVINHSSDQHAWFQAARRAPVGSPARDFYVWTDNPSKYKEARIIFKDFEPSNWSWDPVAKAYFWHRFYHHQPDLNFDNLAVHEAVFQALDFWLDMGVDGLRLDAIPYLYEREGTNCENLPETHAFLKKLRAHMDERYGQSKMLLAEANQWPEDAAAYFGDGDECHMNFHFPIMPRLYMSLQMEDRFPIIDILEQTPAIPPNCQWATFLRNHDELTLEMVTDEERDYMWRVYANDPRARINMGIRRRLAPLLNNNRRRIELINALLFSLPGTPIVYYGDEIGMGDNIYLGDRNGVRTPMQWAPDRNGGFSKANPQQLYLPAIIDPEYHYEGVNVENQRRNLSSLFWWTRRLIAERKRWKAFGHGTIEFLHPDNAKVLTFVREHEEETVLVVANLSRFSQVAELDLSRWAGLVPMEIFSRSKFPEVKAGATMFTLGPHDFYWLALRRRGAAAAGEGAQAPLFDRTIDWQSPLSAELREFLEREVLPGYFHGCAWFPGKSRVLRELHISEEVTPRPELTSARMLLVQASFTDGMPETYVVPIQVSSGEMGSRILAESPRAVIARFGTTGEEQILHDATLDGTFRTALLDLVAMRSVAGGRLKGVRGPAFAVEEAGRAATNSHVVSLEQSNIGIAYGSAYFLKLYRRLEWGKQPEEELARHLTAGQKAPHIAPYAGTLHYTSGGLTATIGLLTGFIQNQGDAWTYTVDAVVRYFERVLGAQPQSLDPVSLANAVGAVFPERAQQLGQRTAELHLALAAESDNVAFEPEPFTTLYQRSLYQAVRGQLRRTLRMVQGAQPQMDDAARQAAADFISGESIVMKHYSALLVRKINTVKIAVHGSYHLGQILNTGKDFAIIDLEGDPARALSERSLKRSPLVDVASMMSSLHYAAHHALRRQQPTDAAILEPWTKAWAKEVTGQFLASYLETAKGAAFLPDNAEDLDLLLNVFRLDRAISEVHNTLIHRPHLASIPLAAVHELIAP